jgi:pimeloyl-ACP methyl ester carboxylesterase
VGDLHVTEWGEGEPAVLVHGSLGWGEESWAAQRPLAEGRRLLLPDRHGFGDSPGPDAGDWEADAASVAALLPAGAHLVGHSYGGVVALLAAARRPGAVRSLCVIEPTALGLVRGQPAVEEVIRRVTAAREEARDPQDYVRRFLRALGLPARTVRLNERALRAAASSWRERPPWEAEIPLESLAGASFPTLVVRGAWDEAPPDARRVGRAAFYAACDALEGGLGARGATVAGVSHGVQRAGGPFNRLLLEFWTESRVPGQTPPS